MPDSITEVVPVQLAQRAVRYLSVLLAIYILYVLVFGVIIFSFHHPPASDYLAQQPISRFYGNGQGPDRVALVEERFDGAAARISLVAGARQTLDISYYSIRPGPAADLFFASLLEAADRGVAVRLLLDGIFHSFRVRDRTTAYALSAHPNIQLKVYEPFCPFRPWRLNNRLHDKMIIVDGQLAMIGGRNIGDRYYVWDELPGAVNDRDVVIINTGGQGHPDSVLVQFEAYYDLLWHHDFSRPLADFLSSRQRRRGETQAAVLREHLGTVEQTVPDLFTGIDWLARSVPTSKVTLIHNPIGRMNKEPWVWYDLTRLTTEAKDSIFVQSPYIIPSGRMLAHLDLDSVSAPVQILTNAQAASPNLPAMAGYRRYRRAIVAWGAELWEYQAPGSIHAKTYIFDSRLSLVGTFNVDPRSAFLSTETMVVIDSTEFAAALEAAIVNQLASSLRVHPDYSYGCQPAIAPKEMPRLRGAALAILSWLIRPFIHML